MDDSIVSLDIALNGRFIMTCSESSITLWTLKGDKLTRIDTKQAPNNSAVISKCSNFIACCGFTTDVKIWEVIMTKAGEFHELSRAMELKGHSAGVLSVSFSQDSKRAVTLSKDRTCRLWNINVSYSLNEDPRTIQIIQLDATSSIPTRLAASPDGLSIAVAIGNSLYVYSTITGELLETLDEVHNSDVSDLLYEPGGRYLVSAGGHDRFIRLWNNVPGMREQVKDLNKRLGKATGEAMKGRLVSQIKELESLISTCENNIQK
jgi:WD40 repeat protein